ncbi:MAG: DUF29 family protein [Nitrospirae bacterium]|nr:DUF29 family protein [Nitrospirota bacterium]
MEAITEKAFKRAKVKFQRETDINQKKLPSTCPYTFEQLIDNSFFPYDMGAGA